MSSFDFKRSYAKELTHFSNKTFPIKTLLVGIDVSKSTVNGLYVTPVIWAKERVNNPRLYKKMSKRVLPVLQQLTKALIGTAVCSAMWLNKADSFFNPPYSLASEYIWDRKSKSFKLVIELSLFSGAKKLFVFESNVLADEIEAALVAFFRAHTPAAS